MSESGERTRNLAADMTADTRSRVQSIVEGLDAIRHDERVAIRASLDLMIAREMRLDLPEDTTLPMFAYGFLKPAELSHSIIAAYVSECKVDAITADLYIRGWFAPCIARETR